MVKAVIFDMDGLLLDTERLALRAWMEGAVELGATLSEETVLQTVGVDWAHTRKIVAGALPGGEAQMDALRVRVQEIYHELMQTDLVVKPGAPELLAALKDAGVPIGLATSTARTSAEWRLNKAGLLEYFDGVACGDEIAHGKPSPDIFLLSAERIGADPTGCVVLEDSPAGLKGAKDAGMGTMMVPDLVAPNEESRKLADYIVADLHEARKILFEHLLNR